MAFGSKKDKTVDAEEDLAVDKAPKRSFLSFKRKTKTDLPDEDLEEMPKARRPFSRRKKEKSETKVKLPKSPKVKSGLLARKPKNDEFVSHTLTENESDSQDNKRKTRKRKEKAGKVKTGKGKKFRPSGGSKFVLFIGDEGVILVHMKGKVVLSRQFAPDASEHNLNEFRRVIEEDPRAPVYMAIDSMDQNYAQQTLPPVSSLSIKKLIKRRLDRDFGPDDIKGAIILGREKKGRKDWNFLMVSLEQSPQLSVWFEFVQTIGNRFAGIYLVAAEIETVIKTLKAAMGISLKKNPDQAEWTFVVSHNKVGGFRQVVLRNGRLAFTRMAQPVGESTPEVLAGNVEQEMVSTIEYMKRLSFNPAAGLDIFVIASEAVKASLDLRKFDSRNNYILTPYEVAEYIGIEGATQPSDQYGDVILATIIGGSRKHVLSLNTPYALQYAKLYNLIRMQRVIVALVSTGCLCYSAYLGYTAFEASSQIEEIQRKRNSEQIALSDINQKIEMLKTNIDEVNDQTELYQQLIKERRLPLHFIAILPEAIKSPVVVKSLNWEIEGLAKNTGQNSSGSAPAAPAPGAPGAPALAPGQYMGKVSLVLGMPDLIKNAEGFRILSKKITEDTQKVLKDSTVQFSNIPKEFADNSQQEINFEAPKSGTAGPLTQLQVDVEIRYPIPLEELPTLAKTTGGP